MKVKQLTAIYLTGIAIVILLAHPIIPHHYHNFFTICISSCSYDTAENNQTQGKDNSAKVGCLEDVFFIAKDNHEDSIFKQIRFTLAQSNIIESFRLKPNLIILPTLLKTSVVLVYKTPSTFSFGLRAPPV